MAILTQEQFMESLRARIGDDTSDEALTFIENMSDTYNDLSNQVKESGNWEQKYRENDTEWRRKYKDAFFKTPSHEEDPIDEPDGNTITINNLFKEGK